MSREIKFRCWSKCGKCWITFGCDRYCFDDGILDIVDDNDLTYEQYTGLEDKNGKGIYEGDIVSVYHSDKLSDHNKFFDDKALVKCSLSKGGAFIIRNWYGERILNWDIPLRFVEVIGNIHENPDLLGGNYE